jgi:hypothetical protein
MSKKEKGVFDYAILYGQALGTIKGILNMWDEVEKANKLHLIKEKLEELKKEIE